MAEGCRERREKVRAVKRIAICDHCSTPLQYLSSIRKLDVQHYHHCPKCHPNPYPPHPAAVALSWRSPAIEYETIDTEDIIKKIEDRFAGSIDIATPEALAQAIVEEIIGT